MLKADSLTEQIAQRLRQAHELLSEAMALIEEGADEFARNKTASGYIKRTGVGAPDFSTPIRPFVKKNVVGMNGSRKFALLVAYLAKGDEKKAVALADVESQWNKMTDKNLLGTKFNRLYSSEAKNEDWVHSSAKGVYYLRPAWKAIFES